MPASSTGKEIGVLIFVCCKHYDDNVRIQSISSNNTKMK